MWRFCGSIRPFYKVKKSFGSVRSYTSFSTASQTSVNIVFLGIGGLVGAGLVYSRWFSMNKPTVDESKQLITADMDPKVPGLSGELTAWKEVMSIFLDPTIAYEIRRDEENLQKAFLAEMSLHKTAESRIRPSEKSLAAAVDAIRDDEFSMGPEQAETYFTEQIICGEKTSKISILRNYTTFLLTSFQQTIL